MIKPLRMQRSRFAVLTTIPAVTTAVLAFFAASSASWADTAPTRTAPETAARQQGDKTRLSGETLRRFLADRRIYLSVPLGGELPLFYRADGHLDGSGDAAGLGRFLAPSDSGRWWVEGERICQKWQSWYDGRTFCFTLDVLGGDRVAWHRDDGEKGVARVGR